MGKQQVSETTKFHTTEALLIERAKLHELVDYFWVILPHTRDDVYQMIATSLAVSDVHISDMDTDQIRQVAEFFHNKLAEWAPCETCKHGRRTSFGVYQCPYPYWCRPENSHRKCDYFVPRNISSEGS